MAEELHEQRPGSRLSICPAYTDEAVVQRGVHNTGMPWFQQPFSGDALVWKVREVLDG